MKNKLDKFNIKTTDLNRAKKERAIEKMNEKTEKSSLDFETTISTLQGDSRVSAWGLNRVCEGSRLDKLAIVVQSAVADTAAGIYPKEHPLHMQKKYGEKIVREAAKLFNHFEKCGKSVVDLYTATGDETQSFINSRIYTKKGEMMQDSTIENVKKVINKINLLECIGEGDYFDYSSKILTRAELSEIDEMAPDKKPQGTSIEKTFSSDDYERIAAPIREKLRNREKTYDYEVAFVLGGDYGLRKATIEGLTVDDLNPQNGWIDVYEENNKSSQLFAAKHGLEPNFYDHEVLSGLYERSLLKNVDSPTGSMQIPIITCNERNLYKGFDTLCKNAGIDSSKYGNEKYRALRRRYAQDCYDDAREYISTKYPDLSSEAECGNQKALREIISKTLVETNYLMGHCSNHINTTIGYIEKVH